MYWKLYASEAEISDRKLVETMVGDTNSMLILVSRDTWVLHSTSTLIHTTEWPFLFHNRGFYPTDVPVSSTRQRPRNRLPIITARSKLHPRLHPKTFSILFKSLPRGSLGGGHSNEYPTTSQPHPGYDQRPSMRSYSAMVQRLLEVCLSPCGPSQARSGPNVSVTRP